MKLIRTIRLDPSDTFVFERAAEPGEWAVSGAFVFSDADPAKLEGKARSAFRGGFLGVQSLGWSTLVQIDAWQEFGFQAVAKTYLSRLTPEKGVRRDIDENGDLLVRHMGNPNAERRSLVSALVKPSWLDPATRGPK